MQELLIVDGYNILNNWKVLDNLKKESLEHAREKLIDMLINYGALEKLKVIIVFDGHKVKGGLGTTEDIAGTQVIFTKEGETADSVIEKLVHQLSTTVKIYVATSDWEEQRIVLGKGALRISARELETKVVKLAKRVDAYTTRNNLKDRSLDRYLTEDVKTALEKWRRR